MKDKIEKTPEMDQPHMYVSHDGMDMKNGMGSKISNGISNGINNGISNGHGFANEYEPGNKPRNRRTVEHAIPEQEPSESPAVVAEPAEAAYMPTRGDLFMDPANICTLLGAVLSSLSMAAMWKGSYDVGMMLNIGANIADILDGPIARSLPKRHPTFSVMGSKLDTYSDMVSHFVVPASLLMQISGLDMLYVGLATIWVITGIVRQSYFEVIERCDDGSCIFGVTSDYMPPLCAMALHLLPIVGRQGQANFVLPALAGCTLFMIYGSLTFSLKSRRYGGFGLFTVTLFNVSLCISLVLMWAWGSFNVDTPLGIWSFEGLSLLFHLIMAYPCYFRFVELNL